MAASGTAGAALGYHATGEPLALVTVPAGIVIAGVSLGAALALGEGVYHRLRRLMDVPEDEAPSRHDPA
jgi:hypothetical protein